MRIFMIEYDITPKQLRNLVGLKQSGTFSSYLHGDRGVKAYAYQTINDFMKKTIEDWGDSSPHC